MLPQHSLQQRIEDIQQLLQKFRLENHLVAMTPSPRQRLERSLVERQHGVKLERHLQTFHSADLAELLEILPIDDRKLVWSYLAAEQRGAVMLELADATLETIANDMSRQDLVDALCELDTDELTYLGRILPAEILQETMALLDASDRDQIQQNIRYSEEMVGHLLDTDITTVNHQQTIQMVQDMLRQEGELPAQTDKLFITDERGHLCGVVSLQSLLLNPADLLITEVMPENSVVFQAEQNLDEAARAFERYDLISAPVINERGKLIGRLTVDAVMDYLRDMAETDALNVAGVIDVEDLSANIWASARNRWLWLGINLVTAFVISRIIGAFETTISQLVALASLMPIIASVAGNTGNQTTALVIRGLALNRISQANLWHLLRKEITIAMLNGVVWGMAVGFFAYVFYKDWALSIVVTVAMMLSFLLAAMIGVSAPVFLERTGRDPAMGSSVILTGLTDALGFAVFLILATIFLV